MKTIHVVPHQHFDIVWRRSINWYVQRRKEIYSQAIELLEKYPEFTFSFSQAYILREFIENNPSFKDRVSALLRSGRLEIIGGLESIPDLNLSSAPAIIRNIEMGKKWFKEFLGYDVRIGAFEDAFGVSKQIPQILKLCDYDFLKASRMPRPGQISISGNFKWQGLDGSIVKCISPSGENLDWGWGCHDNPDSKKSLSYEEKYNKIYNRMLKAASTDGNNILYVPMGEEQFIFQDLPKVLEAASATSGCNYIFSTYSNYFNSLTVKEWSNAPLITKDTDLSRIFTGCYTTRIKSKMHPRDLEYRLLSSEMSISLQNKKAVKLKKSWLNLFVLQFHDAICGCHVDNNAKYLKKLYFEALKAVPKKKALIPWEPQLPTFRNKLNKRVLLNSQDIEFGDFRIEIKNSKLKSISNGKKDFKGICDIVLREENGTLWTEEYSGEKYNSTKSEKVISVKSAIDSLKITIAGKGPEFTELWPGYAKLNWKKTFQFIKGFSGILVSVELDWMGNSTEIALRWGAEKIISCCTEIPFGSIERKAFQASKCTLWGEAFPALNWVKTNPGQEGFAVFNKGTAGHAIRNSKLETILLRSPVKRWSPFFPVTPDMNCWDNGINKFSFIYLPVDEKTSNSSLHRLGHEFNLPSNPEIVKNSEFDNIPKNLVISSLRKTEEGNELLVYEADGKKCKWNGINFKPNQIRKIYIK